MLFDVSLQRAPIAIVKLVGNLLHADSLSPLDRLIKQLREDGCSAVLLDCAQVKRVSASGTVSFIECLLHRHPVPVAAMSPPQKLYSRLRDAGLLEALPVFDDVNDALAAPDLRRFQLTDTKAVVLCSDDQADLGRISQHVPLPLLDIVGRPLLGRVLDQLDQFGVQSAFLNVSPNATTIQDFLHHSAGFGPSVFSVPQSTNQMGEAAFLQNLHDAHAGFRQEVIVCATNFITSADLPALIQRHRAQNADLTILQTSTTGPGAHTLRNGRLISAPARCAADQLGMFILHPRCFEIAAPKPNARFLSDWVPALIQAGADVRMTPPNAYAHHVQSAQDYFAVTQDALRAEIPRLKPQGERVNERLWAHPTAQVHPRAQFDGTAYVGAGVRIDAPATFQDVVSIGMQASIGADTVLRDTIVMPKTPIAPRSFFDRHVVGDSWFAPHSLPENVLQSRLQADHLTTARDIPALMTAHA